MPSIRVPLPLGISFSDKSLFEDSRMKLPPNDKVFLLRDVFVTHTGIVVSEEGVVSSSIHGYKASKKIALEEAAYFYDLATDDPNMVIELKETELYLLVHHPWYNYYHWLMECVPRLLFVRNILDKVVLLLPERYVTTDFIVGSITPFGNLKTYVVKDGASLMVPNLVMPRIKPFCESYCSVVLELMRDFYLKAATALFSKIPDMTMVYLSRRKAYRKHVVNEDEVEALLSKYGFVTICNEDYTFLEQVVIYSKVEKLVSIHGAGLTNMLFMKPGTSVLEILPPKTNELDRPSYVYWFLSYSLGINYYCQINREFTDNGDFFFGNYFVDTEALTKSVQLLLTK